MRVPRVTPNVIGVTVERLLHWTPTLAVWGGVAAVGALFFLEQVPPVKRDILARIPIVGQRYVTEPEK